MHSIRVSYEAYGMPHIRTSSTYNSLNIPLGNFVVYSFDRMPNNVQMGRNIAVCMDRSLANLPKWSSCPVL